MRCRYRREVGGLYGGRPACRYISTHTPPYSIRLMPHIAAVYIAELGEPADGRVREQLEDITDVLIDRDEVDILLTSSTGALA